MTLYDWEMFLNILVLDCSHSVSRTYGIALSVAFIFFSFIVLLFSNACLFFFLKTYSIIFFIEKKLVLHLRLDKMLQYFIIIIMNKTWIILKEIILKLIT